MDKNIRKLLLLVFLIIIPFLYYAFMQMKSLEEDEKRADAVYEKQMDAVLFSLNQYADDMMGNWVHKLTPSNQSLHKNAYDLVLGNESIQMLVLRQMDTRQDSCFMGDYVTLTDNAKQNLDRWYKSKDSLMIQLSNYYKAGFQKIQSADGWMPLDGLRPRQAGISVMVYDQDSTLHNALFIIEPEYWVEQILGGKMQEIAQDEFRLAVLQTQPVPNVIFSTYPFELEKDYLQKKLWILSNTQLAVQSKGISYSELIKTRSRKNLFILFFSVAVLLLGALIIVRNIRNTLKIAQLKSDFVSNVSHEIRTPLSLIRMYAETLMLGRLPSKEKQQHYYEVIHHQSGRLTYLVNNILDFSKIEANRKQYKMTANDLNSLVQRLYSNYEHTFKEQEVTCTLVLSNDPCPIMMDEQAIEVAISNLLDNAIKFSPDEKNIQIKTFIEHGFASCQISDKGIGIPKKMQAKVFEKFFRLEDALTQKTKGTGLGLSLVKHIMDAHNGKINVHSKLGNGSSFTLKFPLKSKT